MRLPVAKWELTPHGEFGNDRGDHKHTGVDLAAPAGTAVYAPEDGEIVAVVAREVGDDLPQPWRGYGPGIVVMKGKTGRYHVLAHLEDDDLEGRWGPWVRTTFIDPAKDIAAQVKTSGAPLGLPDPFGVFDEPTKAFKVTEGQQLGVTSAANHLHWEVRKSKLSGRYNPAHWADQFVWKGRPPAGVVVAASTPEENLTTIILALVAFALLRKNRR